jgi:ABC-type transport system involved in multi-copper enzyme maturation permease subunit
MKAVRLFPPQLNPIIVKEVRMRMRGVRPYAILTLFLVAMAAAGYGIYLLMLRQASFGGMVLSFQVGQSLFSGLALCAVLLMVFLAPAMTSGAISGEREQLTYEMLLATPLRPARILWGKLVAALSYIFLLIFASIPVFSVVLMFGGVAPKDMVKTLLLLLVTAITYGTIGMFCSALVRRTSQATVLSYVFILLLIGTTTMASALWSYFSAPTGQAIPPQLLYLNPFSALISIVTITPDTNSGMFLGGDVLNLPILNQLSIGVVHYGPNGPIVLPIYRATLLFYALLTVTLYWISSHMVLPRHRWRPRRGDLRFVLLLAGIVGVIWLVRDWWFVLPPQNP